MRHWLMRGINYDVAFAVAAIGKIGASSVVANELIPAPHLRGIRTPFIVLVIPAKA